MNNEKIGKYIKKLRTDKGISQNELGEIVHVTRQAVSSWENGKTLPDSDILVSLSEYFHVSINKILSGNDEEKDIEKVTLELVDENNNKTKRIRKLSIIANITILSLLTLFLGLYFITNYNSIQVYRTFGETNHFRMNDGIIISTAENTYFKLGELKTKQEDSIIKKVKLYYEYKDQKETIFENEISDRLYTQKKGYNELHKNKLEKYKNHLYLEITYNENEKEVMKIKIREKFKKDSIIVVDESNILKKENKDIQITYEKEQKEYEEEDPIIEEQQVKTEVVLVEPTESSPPEEEEEIVEINYEEIATIIQEHGRYERRTYILEYQLEDRLIIISNYKNTILVEQQQENINKTWNNNISWEINISYQEYDNYELVKSININPENQEEYQEIIDEMNNNLLLVYQEIE